MLPNALLAGLAVSCPSATPVPETDNVVGEFEASLLSVNVASNVPLVSGANFTLKVTFCPTGITIGNAGEVKVKYFVEELAPLMVTGADPELVALIVRILLFPAVTLPKSKVPFAIDRAPAADCPPPEELNPMQPVKDNRVGMRTRMPAIAKKWLLGSSGDFL